MTHTGFPTAVCADTRASPAQAYWFFYDKLEKANYFLENVLSTLDEPNDGRLVAHLLKDPLCDGGQFDMIVNLAAK